MAELDEVVRAIVAEWVDEPFSQDEDDAQILTDRMMVPVKAALEDCEQLRAEIRELRGLGWEHLKRDKFPLIRAALEGRDG